MELAPSLASQPSAEAKPTTIEAKSPKARAPTHSVPFRSPSQILKRKVLPTTYTEPPSAFKRLAKAAPSTARGKSSSQPIDTRQIRNDRLGTLVSQLCKSLSEASSWETFVDEFRGPSYLSSRLDALDHPAAPLLQRWRDEGVPAKTMSEPWTREQLDACVERGCHFSATQHSEFMRDELATFVEDRFWVVLPYDTVRHFEHLMLWPVAVKEERERKPRVLCDLSWDWGWPSVNDTTIAHAPPEAMQFGGALRRILHLIRHANPKYGPPRLAKHDIKDGFYRLYIQPSDCLRLAQLLPRYDGEPQLIGIPLACPMGWVQSPPTFCTMSETVCDLANAAFAANPKVAPAHCLDEAAAALDDLSPSFVPRPRPEEDALASQALAAYAEPGPSHTEHLAPPSNMPSSQPLGHTDVFMDDYIQIGQGGPRRMNTLRRHLLHAVDQVLATPEVSPHPRNEAISLKKLKQGDGSWATRKVVLGWVLDTLRQTIELPPHRKLALAQIFADLNGKRRVSAKKWHSILGKLRFVSTAIPGSSGLFCALQLALNRASDGRIRITQSLRHHLNEFARLAADLRHRPTHLAEIVPQKPTYQGATDAAKAGMGGIFFDPSGQGYLWRYPFPLAVQERLVSADNPTGDVTNSDLEQAGQLGQASVIAASFPVAYTTIATCSDNTPALSRLAKGAISNDGAGARLCGYACNHQRLHRYCHVGYFLPGKANVMADDTSRLQHLSDPELLAHFEQHYPQAQPWQLLQLQPEAASKLISALLCKQPLPLTLPSTSEPKTRSSESGPTSATTSTSHPASLTSTAKKTSSPTSSSLPSATADADKPTTLSALKQWTKPSWRWGRGSPTWVSQIPASKSTPEEAPPHCIPYSLLSSKPYGMKTTQNPVPTQPTSPSFVPSSTPSTPKTPNMVLPTRTSSTLSLSPSIGSSGQLSTWTRPPKVVRRPSSSKISTSPSTAPSTTPHQRLCMTHETSLASHTRASPLLTKRMLSKGNKWDTAPPMIRSYAPPRH